MQEIQVKTMNDHESLISEETNLLTNYLLKFSKYTIDQEIH